METLALFLLQFPMEVEGGGVWPQRTALPVRALIRPGARRGRGWALCLVLGARPRGAWAAEAAAFGGFHWDAAAMVHGAQS